MGRNGATSTGEVGRGVSGPGSNVVMVLKVDTYFARHQVEMELNVEENFYGLRH